MAQTPPEKTPTHARQPGPFLVVGRVVRPHGIRGEILVEGVPELMASLSPGKTVFVGAEHMPMEVAAARPHQQRFLVDLEGVASRDQAEVLRAAEISLRSDEIQDLTPGAYYHWQILGLIVESDVGEFLGKVSRIIETGANDVYVVSRDAEKDLLIPAISSVVRSVDLEAGVLTVILIPGLREIQE